MEVLESMDTKDKALFLLCNLLGSTRGVDTEVSFRGGMGAPILISLGERLTHRI